MPPKAPSNPSWILPGQVINPVMKDKAILETSLTYSHTFNSRNIEFPWYALWAQTLSDLVADIPNLIVAPQFPVWFVPIHDEHEDEDDGNDPKEIIQLPEEQPKGPEQNAPGNQADDKEVGCGVGDVSFASTVPEKDADQVVVDFVILHLMAVAQPQRRVHYGGWRITAVNIGLLVEVKWFVSRSLEGKEQEDEIIEHIAHARDDLIDQAAHVFIKHPKKDFMLAIAASGNCPYHLSAVHVMTVILQVHIGAALQFTVPKSLRPCTSLLRRTRVIKPLTKNQPTNHKPNWNRVIRVDLASSRNCLQTIYNSLKTMGGLGTPVDV
ncbi:hypothetical protein EDB19DRAFT_1964633 [Suillus lakei]|nr:hypothetical protein EDB19DRAFT_1964633 [Suillus lakei]